MDLIGNTPSGFSSQPPASSSENDFFDIVIKISIPLIIVLILVLFAIILKPWNLFQRSQSGSSQNNSYSGKYLEISNPVYTLSGAISQIKENIIYLQVTTLGGQTIVPINVTDTIPITQIGQSITSAAPSPVPQQIRLNQLQRGQILVITTIDDIRLYTGEPLRAASISILNNITNGTIDTISDNSIKIITNGGSQKQVDISAATVILSDGRHSIKISPHSLVIRDTVQIVSDSPSELSSKITALQITATPQIMGAITKITPTDIVIERRDNENDLSVTTNDTTTYHLYSFTSSQMTPINRDQLNSGDIIAVDSPDFDLKSNTVTGQNIRIYHP